MKRTVLMVLMIVSAAALFANGNAEAKGADADEGTTREWTRGGRAFDEDFTPPAEPVWNPVELTGTVEMVEGHAVLTADGKTYLLTIPRIAWYADEVDEGTVVTVRGQLTDTDVVHEQVEFEGDGHILVQQVEMDGEVFAVGPGGRFDMAPRDPRGAMRGGYDDDRRFGGPDSDDELYGRQAPRDDRDDFRRGPEDFNRRPMPRGRRG